MSDVIDDVMRCYRNVTLCHSSREQNLTPITFNLRPHLVCIRVFLAKVIAFVMWTYILGHPV